MNRPSSPESNPESGRQADLESKKEMERQRYEQIREISEGERKDRVARKLARIRENKEKNKKRGQRDTTATPKQFERESKGQSRERNHYKRIADKLLKNVEASILIDSKETQGHEKDKRQIPEQRLNFEAEVTLDRLFRRFRPDLYQGALKAKALTEALRLHQKAHRSIEVSIRQLKSKENNNDISEEEKLELGLLETIQEFSRERYYENLGHFDDIKEELSLTEGDEEDALAEIKEGFENGLNFEQEEIESILKRAEEMAELRENDQLPKQYKGREIDLKRVANHRKIRKLQHAIESIPQEERNSDKGEELRADLDAALQEQTAFLSKTQVKLDQERESGSSEGTGFVSNREKKSALKAIADAPIGTILERYESTMLPSEKEKWDQISTQVEQIQRLANLAEQKSDESLENIIRAFRSELTEAGDLNLVELISNPEIVGRLKLYYNEKWSESLNPDENHEAQYNQMLQSLEDYESWKLTGEESDRIAAAHQDFLIKLMMLQEEDFTTEDLFLTMAEYNLAYKDEDGQLK
ncbi:hypothetical protein GF389_02065, partial [Candidatus Dojkabacteria bacterium]|nr:hypothetical protein [Candidatus Dojkabacteria bacterium]